VSYAFVAATVLLTVYGQVIMKWQVLNAGSFPDDPAEKLWFLFRLLMNPWIVSSYAAALLASLCWMAAMTKLDLSHAYPFTSATFVLVIILGGTLFAEPITWPKLVGMILVIAGIAIGSQG
jgi:multidrug transporter EmrE-like cation transporter